MRKNTINPVNSETNNNIALEVNKLTKKFGSFTAVNGISFSIEKGKIFGFLGPNGSGKSTTIRMLCGVLTPTSGEAKVMGYDIVNDTEMVRQNIGYMSQRFSLYEDLTVEENLNFYSNIYLVPRDISEQRKRDLIDMANLNGKEKSLVGTLSGGWKQRLALGCALIHKPKLLILDEPTGGVDPVSRRNFWEIIHELAKQGITVLVTTHYMDEAESCDVTGFIFDGNIMEIASPTEIIRKTGASNLEDVFISMVENVAHKKIISSYQEIKSSDNETKGEHHE